MERERVIELFAGGIFVALLLIVALMVVNPSVGRESKTTIISNSFNTYAYPISGDGYSQIPYHKIYYDSGDDYGKRYRSMDYDDFPGNYLDRGVFGNGIKRHYVYVRNRESAGGYFTVKFHFKDDYGRIKTESVTKYINAHEEDRFSYSKIYDDDYKYWKYNVVSESKVPSRY